MPAGAPLGTAPRRAAPRGGLTLEEAASRFEEAGVAPAGEGRRDSSGASLGRASRGRDAPRRVGAGRRCPRQWRLEASVLSCTWLLRDVISRDPVDSTVTVPPA